MFTQEKFLAAIYAWAEKNGERILPYWSADDDVIVVGGKGLPLLIGKILEKMQLPTETSAEIAFRTLLAEGLEPTDGLTQRKRENAARARQQKKVEEAVEVVKAVPLSKAELDEFVQLTPQEVREKRANDLYFRTRYDEAARLYGFQVYE
jgi:hypothetical protein